MSCAKDSRVVRRSDLASVAGSKAWKAPVRVATVAALPAYTRTGNTIEANANGALSAQDGVTLNVDDRFLVKSESGGNRVDHGIYVLISAGSGGTKWSAERAEDFDESADIVEGACVAVLTGSTNAGSLWYLTQLARTLNTDVLLWEQETGTGGGGGGASTIYRKYTFGAAPIAGNTQVLNLVGGYGTDDIAIVDATLKGIAVQIGGSHSAGTLTVKMRVNGSADATMTLAIPSGTDTTAYTTGVGASVVAGDLVGAQVEADGSWDGAGPVTVEFRFTED